MLASLAIACADAQPAPAPDCTEPTRHGAGPLAGRRAPRAAGALYRVDPAGDDRADCSRAAPCREIARVAPLLRAGDLLLVGEGDYAPFELIEARGSAMAPIVLFAEGAGAVVRGEPCDRRDRSCRDAIYIERSHHLVLDGVGASDAARAGLAVELGRDIAVRNGVFADNGRWGIFSSFVDDLVIEHNQTRGSVGEHGIYASNSGDRTIIRANLVHDNRASGIQINADWNVKDATGFYPGEVDGITTGAVVESNVIYRNGPGGGGAINLDGVQDSVVRNNLLVANQASGIVAYGDADGSEDDTGDDGDGRLGPRGMIVEHNTVVQPPGGRAALLFRYSVGPNRARNNILVHPDGPGLLVGGDDDIRHLDSDHNVLARVRLGNDEPVRIIDLAAWQARGRDAHSIAAARSVLFAPGCDFALAGDSPARGGGRTEDLGALAGP